MISYFKTLAKAAEDRMNHPVMGAFLTSWVVFNWQPIAFFLLSSKSVEQKLESLPSYVTWWAVAPAPLVSAFIYVAFLPYFSNWIDSFVTKAFNRSEKEKNRKKEEKMKAETQLEILGYQQERAKRERKEEIDKNITIESLEQQIIDLGQVSDKRMVDSEERIAKLNDQIQTQQQILKDSTDNYESTIESYIKREAEQNEKHTKYINELLNRNSEQEAGHRELSDNYISATVALSNILREIREFLKQKDHLVIILRNDLNNYQRNNDENSPYYSAQASALTRRISEAENDIEKFQTLINRIPELPM